MWFDVTDFGADRTGQANATPGIQAAIDAAAATGGWATVFAPAGEYLISQIRMKSRVVLRGEGYRTAFTQISATANKDAIVLDSTSTDKIVLRDFRLVGNKAAQTTANRGIFLGNAGGSGFDMGDSVHVVENVIIKECKSGGFAADSGVRELRAINVFIQACDGPGFDIVCTDSDFLGCTAGASGVQGWYVGGANNRFVACKGFGSGTVTPAAGHGWFVEGDRNQFAACEAQDNDCHGFVLFNAEDCVLSACCADTNGVDAGNTGVGFRLDNADNCLVTGNAFNRAGQTATQDYAVTIAGTSTNNSIVLSSRAHSAGDIDGAVGATNFALVNGRSYLNVVPTANLPAAAAAQNGRVLVEDGGNNNRNLVLYAGGQRFRIDGGAPF
jgi:hypothetical protein